MDAGNCKLLLNPFVFLLVGMGLQKWKPDVQGKGFMHRVLEHPFAEAASKGIPCVLYTDTSLKVKKYIWCGMELCGKKIKHGISLYTMAYNKTKERSHYDG